MNLETYRRDDGTIDLKEAFLSRNMAAVDAGEARDGSITERSSERAYAMLQTMEEIQPVTDAQVAALALATADSVMRSGVRL